MDQPPANDDVWLDCWENFKQLMAELDADAVMGLEHGEIENLLWLKGRMLLCTLMQGVLNKKTAREQRLPEVIDANDVLD